MNYPATRVTAGENAQQRLHAHLTIPFAMIRRHRVTFARLLTLRHDQDDPDFLDERFRGGGAVGGTNLWVLFFAILIASIGLNVNSTAVIIGAMKY